MIKVWAAPPREGAMNWAKVYENWSRSFKNLYGMGTTATGSDEWRLKSHIVRSKVVDVVFMTF